MKCTNNIRLLCILCVAAIFLSGCGKKNDVALENSYYQYTSNFEQKNYSDEFYARDLCVTGTEDIGVEKLTYPEAAEAAGVFNLNRQEVTFSKNIFDKMYPASTTKIVTALIILRDCNLDDMVTVSKEAANPGEKSSVCGVAEGDVISVHDLLYGLMLSSGNDAAIALAEHHSGSVKAFSDVMNATIHQIGATNSHFVNPHGLPDEEHYTTIYDMYLIMKEAVKYDEFKKIISTQSHKAIYSNAKGEEVEHYYNNTCQYISGKRNMPKNIDVIGGKTGTTYAAGYCLVLYSENQAGEGIVSIVFKTNGRSDLYFTMDEILSMFGK